MQRPMMTLKATRQLDDLRRSAEVWGTLTIILHDYVCLHWFPFSWLNTKNIPPFPLYSCSTVRVQQTLVWEENSWAASVRAWSTPRSFLVDVFSSSMSSACFSISPVYCSTCSLSILIWSSRSWTAFTASTRSFQEAEKFTCQTNHSSADWALHLLALSSLSFMRLRMKGRQ